MRVWTRVISTPYADISYYRALDNTPSPDAPRWVQTDISDEEWGVIITLADYFVDLKGPVYFVLPPDDDPTL